MRLFSTALLAATMSWIGVSTAHNIQLKAHARECFNEILHKGDKMTVTFQVGDREFGGSGNLDIDFWVCSPRIRGTKRQSCTYVNKLLRMISMGCRSRTRTADTKNCKEQSHPETTPLTRTWMGNTHTASATSTGPPTARKSPSTCTESCIFLNPKLLPTRLRLRVC